VLGRPGAEQRTDGAAAAAVRQVGAEGVHDARSEASSRHGWYSVWPWRVRPAQVRNRGRLETWRRAGPPLSRLTALTSRSGIVRAAREIADDVMNDHRAAVV
jgi:hypothetical protein